MATTSFTRLFMKYSKEKQACFNKLDKTLRKSNVTLETSIESLNTFKDENKNVFEQKESSSPTKKTKSKKSKKDDNEDRVRFTMLHNESEDADMED